MVYAEGEDERVLRAAQSVIDEKLAQPILIGRRRVIESRIRKLGLRIATGEDFELVDPQSDPRYEEYWTLYHRLMERTRRVARTTARTVVRTSTTVIAALMVKRGEADAMICGTDRPLRPPSAACARRHRAAPRRAGALGADGADPAQGHLLHRRHPCHVGSDGRSTSPR